MKKVVHTVITDNYDSVKEIVGFDNSDWQFLLYTNNKNLKSKTWTIIYTPELNNVKRARAIKILPPHDYDQSIWIDGSIQVNCNLTQFIEEKCEGDFVVMNHPDRQCVYEEAKACIRLGKDNPVVIQEQIKRYSLDYYPHNNGMVATGFIYRKKSESVDNFCKLWLNEVLHYSHRDQLSFNYIRQKTGISVYRLSFNILNNEFLLKKHLKR